MTVGHNNAEETCLNNHLPSEEVAVSPAPESSNASDIEKASTGDLNWGLSEKAAADVLRYGATSTALQPSTSASPTLSFPEGGCEAWLVVFGSFCAMWLSFGIINCAGVFLFEFQTNQLADYTASQIGWIFSLYLFIVFFVGIQVGPIFDRYGPRWLVLVGSLMSSASLLLLGFCKTYYQIILTYSVLGGLGGALINTPSYGVIAHFFEERRGFATGIATTAGSLGGIVFPIILEHLLSRIGFAWSTRVLGFILLGFAVPANLFIRSRLPPKVGVASVFPDFTVFRDRRFALASLGIFFMEWGLFVPLTFIVQYGSEHGSTDTAQSYGLLSILNAGSIVGRLFPGLLADKLGRFNTIIGTITLCTITTLGLWLPAGYSKPILTAYAVLFGFASGSNLGLIPVCLGQLCDPREFGRYLSTAMMVASFGTLSSVPIGGALLGVGGYGAETGWTALIVFSGLAYAIALACYTSARVLAVGWGFRTKF